MNAANYLPVGNHDPTRGVQVEALIFGEMPEPTLTFEWGKDIPEDVMDGLREGKIATAMLDGKPYKIILIDSFGAIREKAI